MCKVEMAHRYMWRPYLERARASIWSQYVIFMMTDYAMVKDKKQSKKKLSQQAQRRSNVFPVRSLSSPFFGVLYIGSTFIFTSHPLMMTDHALVRYYLKYIYIYKELKKRNVTLGVPVRSSQVCSHSFKLRVCV